MHILMMILGVIGALGFWWYRIRAAGDVAGEVIDAAGRARGAIKRRNFRNKAGQSPFAAIDDPVVGAATVILAIGEECGAQGEQFDASVKAALGEVAPPDLAEEAVIYGRWAIGQANEASTAIRLVGPVLAEALTVEEREHMVAMAERLVRPAAQNANPLPGLIDKLRQKTGLQVA